jgi:acetolactate synthase-1/2/3 large subunit
MDAIAMFRPITKWSQSIGNEGTVPEIVRKAFKLAHTEKPGACVIELPEDLAKRQVSVGPMGPIGTRRPAADHKAVARAVDLIEQAKTPLILAGNGAVRKRASKQLRRLARKGGIPVVGTFMGKGAVSLDDPHCLFTIGLQGKDHVLELFHQADLIVSVGYDLVEYAPAFWSKGAEKRIVHVDFEIAEIDADYRATVELVADIADSLWQICEELNRRHEGRLPLWDIQRWAPLRQRIWDDLTAEAEDTSFPMKPQRIINDLRKALGANDVVLSDVGAHKMWIARYFQCYEPNTCLISNGFCSMGFALPGAIGAKVALPDSNVVAVCGDAGFLMNVQDLETAVRIGSRFVCIVWVDGEYGLIKWKQQNHFQGRHSELAFGNPDFELLARSFGMWGRTVTSAAGFADALDEALQQQGPALLAVPVDYAENRKLTKRLGEIELAI